MRLAVLTPQPISKSFNDELTRSFEETIVAFSMSELLRHGIFRMLLNLRSIKFPRLIVAMEHDGDHALLPVLQVAAIISGAETLFYFDKDQKIRPLKRIKILSLAAQFSGSFFFGIFNALKAYWELRALLITPRKKPIPPTGPALYLRAGNWGESGTGGASTHTIGVINAMIDLGQDVIFASSKAMEKFAPRSNFLVLPPLSNFCLPRELNFYRLHYAIIHAFKAFPPIQRPAFVYQRLSLGNWSGVILSHKFNVPLVIEYNGSEIWIAKNWGNGFFFEKLATMVEKCCLHHADVIVTISPPLRDDLLKKGIEADRIVTQHNGVDTEQFNPDRFSKIEITDIKDRLGISHDSCLVTFIGTFGPWHGVEILAEAITKFHQENINWLIEKKVHFLIIGDGSRRRDVEETLVDCSDHVTFTGLIPYDEAPLFMAASDIFVSPHVRNADGSAFFGSPTKLFEYLAMGRPVIASNIEQIGQIMEDCPKVGEISEETVSPERNQCGILVNAGEAEELCMSIHFLIENPEWRCMAGKNARHLAISRYTWKQHVRTILKAVTDISSRA